MAEIKLLAALMAFAMGQGPAQTDWRQLADRDLAAAHDLLSTNHPAARPSVQDQAFVDSLETAYRKARDRLRHSDSEAAYRAVLRGFAVGIGDPHINVRFSGPGGELRWPGLMVRYVAGEFRVAHVDTDLPQGLAGARLAECDGVSAATMGAARLGEYRAVWTLPAERTLYGPFLLIDDGNPFAPPPRQCRFETAKGAMEDVTLDWRSVPSETINRLTLAERARFGKAQDGLSFKGDVAWIGMASMNSQIDPAIAAVANDAERIRAARAIIIDLRGNGGGSSRKGDELISALFGRGPDAGRSGGDGGLSHWRATPFVLETIEMFRAERAKTYGENSQEARIWIEEADQVRAAIAKGEEFAPSLRSLPRARRAPPPLAKPSKLARKTFVLTDPVCVSSCLMLVDRLRALGVRQIGWETNASRRYMEVRSAQLPSGKARFSTLQKVSLAAPNWLGPFVPDLLAPSTLASASDLESWVLDRVQRMTAPK